MTALKVDWTETATTEPIKVKQVFRYRELTNKYHVFVVGYTESEKGIFIGSTDVSWEETCAPASPPCISCSKYGTKCYDCGTQAMMQDTC